ncbi:mechanosensitive ion channel protein MscS [Tetzosporium hominis]|uniref:Mechanosensitive ion channel protein MscS n=1 Tax=Tetzosporium hominis TaxID=2020506 RepID=A0A264W5W3_9BACL|nr:mechanosensitive ion channel family protein [Tetzosporium hominis]OZS78988.1 mechanosensitive ion channel protein MscS [Tetzosporium hominis]
MSVERMWERTLEFIMNEALWISIGTALLKILLILVLMAIVVKIGKSTIERVMILRSKTPIGYTERRQNTLIKLLQNGLTYIVYFAGILAILSTVNINVAGLLAGAGIAGLAIGFGAQSLVKDIITGFFIIFEDQFAVGDTVMINQSNGTVQEIGLRTTKIKTYTGELHIIPNGNISEVINYSIFNSLIMVDVSVAYESDVDEVERLINEFLDTTLEKYPELVARPDLLGVQALGASDVVMRISAETLPMNHFKVGRMLRRDIKRFLDEHNIEIPYQKMVVFEQKGGGKANAGQ